MLAQTFTTAIARFFANAIAGISAALVLNRSGDSQMRESAAGSRHAESPLKVQLWVAKGVPLNSSGAASPVPSEVVSSDVDDPLTLQIKTHREAISLYEGKAHGPDISLRVFARDILPHLRQHLAVLESLQSENRHAGR